MFGIFTDYFLTLIMNLKSFFCFMQFYLPDIFYYFLGLKAWPQVSVVDRQKSSSRHEAALRVGVLVCADPMRLFSGRVQAGS